MKDKILNIVTRLVFALGAISLLSFGITYANTGLEKYVIIASILLGVACAIFAATGIPKPNRQAQAQ